MGKPCRKNVRLGGWDYSSDVSYHVTICTADKKPIFGCVEHELAVTRVLLSKVGEACRLVIEDEACNSNGLRIDNYVIMPNHVHLLLSLSDGCNLGQAVGRIKSRVTKLARGIDANLSLWQRGYHEHIIRDEADYQAAWEYIDANPAKWADDELYVR